MGNLELNLDEIENVQSDPIPAGRYVMQAVNSEVKVTSAGDGRYVKYELEVLEGPHTGRKVFALFNIENKSEKAQQIGRGQLKSFAKACGLASGLISDSFELHEIPVVVRVDVDTHPEYGAQNRVKGFYPKGAESHTRSGGMIVSPAVTVILRDDDIPL